MQFLPCVGAVSEPCVGADYAPCVTAASSPCVSEFPDVIILQTSSKDTREARRCIFNKNDSLPTPKNLENVLETDGPPEARPYNKRLPRTDKFVKRSTPKSCHRWASNCTVDIWESPVELKKYYHFRPLRLPCDGAVCQCTACRAFPPELPV